MTIQRQQAPAATNAKTVCLTLEQLTVNHLYSKDWHKMKKREGALEVKVNGQASTLSWATDQDGKLKNPGKFQGAVVYVGEGGNTLDTQLAVVETDRAQFAAFHEKLSKAITLAKTASAFAPTYAPAVALVGDFAELIMQVVATTVDDDLELAFHGGLLSSQTAGPINDPDLGLVAYTSIDRPKPNDEPHGVECEFRTWELPTLEEPQSISLFIEDLDISPKASVKKKKLLFEATFGGGSQGQTFKFECDTAAKKLYPLVSDKLVYRGKWSGFLPFNINLVAVTEADREALYKAVEASVPLLQKAAQMRGVSEEEATAGAATVENACKALQSLEALAAEFVKDKISIGTVSGVLVRNGSDGAAIPRICKVFRPNGTLDMEASTETGGGFRIKLRLEE